MKRYEALFILLPRVEEQAMDEKLEKIRGEIVKLGGKVDAATRMGRNAFARPMKKKDSGVYILVTFSLDPKELAHLKERYKLNEDVLRVQIVIAPPPSRLPDKEKDPVPAAAGA